MFLVPMYLGRKLGYDIEFVYPTASFNKEYKNEYRGVKLTSIRSRSQYYCTLWSEKEMFWWLIKMPEILMFYHFFGLMPET